MEDAARASATEALLQTLGPSQASHINPALLETLGTIYACLSQGQDADAASPTSTAAPAARVECALLQLLSQSAAGVEGLVTFCREKLVKMQSSSKAEALSEADAISLGQDPAVVEAAFIGEATTLQLVAINRTVFMTDRFQRCGSSIQASGAC